MSQGVLGFKYEEEKGDAGMTGAGGTADILGFAACDGHIGADRAPSSCKAAGLD